MATQPIAPRTINVLTVIDAETLVKNYQNHNPKTTADKPAFVSEHPQTIHMIASTGDSIHGSDSSELRVAAYVDDIIRWRAVSISIDTSYTVELYKFTKIDDKPTVITKPREIPSSTGRYWQAVVIAGSGTETYDLSFKILDRSGTELVYLTWDPYITAIKLKNKENKKSPA
ncbi:MAG: hypothetical protein F6J93_37025 [Oscillatoria sp. SIO1A7]|nr:hypothetical protein [Oscillatoria sp. SIO1A7]